MEFNDDTLEKFAATGAPPLPDADVQDEFEHDGARLWHASFGSGPAVLLLHGGLGHSGNWGHQIPALLAAGYRVVSLDTRGHGRSTRDARPFSYELLASDAHAVLDRLGIARAALVGWSDGACTSLVLARQTPACVAGVFYFACNMDPTGVKEFAPTPTIDRCLSRHRADYAQLSESPEDFPALLDALGAMQRTQPNYGTRELAEIRVPVTIAHAEHDEFIRREHAEHLARAIVGAKLALLPGVSHFAPLQRPAAFNAAVLSFLAALPRK
ncbi:MAG: alpha/beta hydrolase [Opitutae bacterium]|nr:alpha/beta hydrolase [Opitutae bacterium]